MGIAGRKWGGTPDRADVELLTLARGQGMKASISIWDGLPCLIEPDDGAGLTDVVSGYCSLDGYLNDCFPLGRVSNRIAGLRFCLKTQTLPVTPQQDRALTHGP